MTHEEILGMVVIAFGTLIGLFVTVGKPIIGLNRTLTRFDITLDRLSKDFDKHVIVSKTEFDELWESEERQDNELKDHDNRLIKLETKRTRKKATE